MEREATRRSPDEKVPTESEATLDPTLLSPAFERHYAVDEVADLWNLSEDVVRQLFRDENGVLAIGSRRGGSKRRYLTLRIPASVVEKVHQKLSLVSND